MDGFQSSTVFDGFPDVQVFDQVPRIRPANPSTCSQYEQLQQILLAKTKVANDITKTMICNYHYMFSQLYNRAINEITRLNNAISFYTNPLRELIPVTEFHFQPIPIKDGMLDFVKECIETGRTLEEVLFDRGINSYDLIQEQRAQHDGDT